MRASFSTCACRCSVLDIAYEAYATGFQSSLTCCSSTAPRPYKDDVLVRAVGSNSASMVGIESSCCTCSKALVGGRALHPGSKLV